MFSVRPVVWHFIWWLILAPLLLLELRALDSLREQIALYDSERIQRVRAEVTGQRDEGVRAMVRYRFVLSGDPTTYSASDMVGRHELWIPVEPAALPRIEREKRIEVAYLPENPWVNQPINRSGNPVADGVAGWLLFVLLDLVWVGETFLIVRNFLRCTTAAERRQPIRMRFWRSVRA